MITNKSIVGRLYTKKSEETVNSKTDIINKKINDRLKRKEMLAKMMNKLHDPDIG